MSTQTMSSRTSSSVSCSSSSRRSAVLPFRGSRKQTVVRASAEPQAAAKPMAFKKIVPLTWEVDKETAKEVFAFAGPAPERANGRAAMLGFTSLALAELSTHTPALEQVSGSLVSIVLVSLTLTFATILPKLVSGSSLKDLHAAATSENLKAEGLLGNAMALFDTNLELWSGRLAMIGFSGLLVAEAIKGDALF